jgi:alanyl-tRNA synthetase
MTSRQIRQQFLDFFASKGHLIVPSAPLVAKNDPTLMFNNSGMAQFKDFFLGNGTPPSKRISDTQKCLRVSGKHNDLEDVGFDTYHHTMFEMLGNWSFGDYFKKEALAWSWELLTEVYKLPKDRIYVSVFQGDEKDGVPFDQEAWDIWKSMVGEDRIILGNKKDNFWEMGETGPCGPCSEIHIDLRNADEVAKISGKDLVNNDHPQVVEIWNNVFMQFERMADGSLVSLPSKHVDTGMGFERLCMAIQGKQSNYDTDVFSNTIKFIGDKAGKTYGEEKWADIALRVISDHIRAIAFAIADGQLPSNNKAGYVIRRILRRAVRYGYTYLGFREPFMNTIIPMLADQFDGVFPELKAQQDFIQKVIFEEEISFFKTLKSGIQMIENYTNILSTGHIGANEEMLETDFETSIQIDLFDEDRKNKHINGSFAFILKDRYGFPFDLTRLIANEKGWSVDENGYNVALQAQKDRSRKDSTKEATDWVIVSDEAFDFEFAGYDETETQSKITKYRKVKTKTGEEYHIVLDKTPFYAEMGGQVGDSGELIIDNNQIKFNKITISDTKKENDLFIHISTDKKASEFLSNIEAGSIFTAKNIVTAKIDTNRRQRITQNHTATHLMLSAMRQVLGSHISQKGSFQNEEVTRFDFAHFSKVTDEELAKIEEIVNQKIRKNIKLDEKRNVPIQEAVSAGATATFGEKYGDFVRVITFDPTFSVELCGGTHVPATGEIGIFKFVAESSVSAGVRRVEAYTGEKAMSEINKQLAIIEELKELFKGQSDIVKAVKALQEERNALLKKIEILENEKLQEVKERLYAKIISVGDINMIAEVVEVHSADALKQLAYELKAKIGDLYCVLGAEVNGKPQLAVMIAENLIASKNLNAGQIIKEIAKEIKGGGGGQPFFATAGGNDVSGLKSAIEKGKSFIS